MQICWLILFIVWPTLMAINKELCEHTNSNWYIKSAFYFNGQLVLFASDRKCYQAIGFKFDAKDNRISFDDIGKSNIFINGPYLDALRFTFPYENSVIVIESQTVESIPLLIGNNLTFNREMTKVFPSEPIKLDPYIAVPTEDPMNLMSILIKFPEKDIESNLKAIVTFPFDQNLKKRLFVYYAEHPTKMASKTDLNEIKYKRHVFIESISDFVDYKEMNWIYDNKSGSCAPIDTKITSACSISDSYDSSANGYSFHLIEFMNKKFAIKRVDLNKDGSVKDLVLVKDGSIFELFGCNGTASPKPPEMTLPVTRPVFLSTVGPKGENLKTIIRIVIILLFISAIFLGLFIIYRVLIKIFRDQMTTKS